MSLDTDIERITEQERRLQFERFGAAEAWALGTALKALAESRGQAVTIEIRLVRETVFFFAMPGTTPVNADWARRKRNVVDLMQRSSYRVGRELERDGGSLESKLGLATRDHATHGGSFPIVLRGSGCIGTVTVSGLPQREDHSMLVEVLATMCGVPLAGLALDG
ncbi:MAG: heme-degrading domain-containing protein [Piscinibacter sp.]